MSMKITALELKVFTARQEVSMNDEWNKQHKRGTHAANMILRRLAVAKYGICFDPGKDRLSMDHIRNCGF